MSKKYLIAVAIYFTAAVLFFLTSRYAKAYSSVAEWIYLATSIGLIVAILADRKNQPAPANRLKPNGWLRIEVPGKYRLIAPYLSLASEFDTEFAAGQEFTVTEVSIDDSVIFSPELGGYVYCELPATQVTESPSP